MYNNNFLLFVFCLWISSSSSSCPNGWTRHDASCYHFSHDTESMPVAAIVCQQMGGLLAEIESPEEGGFLSAQAKSLNHDFWIALSDIQEEGIWLWYGSKTPLATTGYKNWANHEPDNYNGDENCALLGKSAGQWWDNPCHNFKRYICEKTDEPGEIVG
ncbi:C-type lectin domain family 4 member M-like [Mercenaria mercenaria]|uniref:C-type lectin domain family 4 member M-like n=1 Tax=Mercenaria mercenaria TaxID=6596 RepID=UPI00234E588F|nr:C-type lectin domain family 4 member M-like [Mercenaria mercenaria]